MGDLKIIKPPAKLPGDTAGVLREIADAMDRGEVTEFVGALVREGDFVFVMPSSISDSLVLSVLLHEMCVSKYRQPA